MKLELNLKQEVLMDRYKDYIILYQDKPVKLECGLLLSYAEANLGYRDEDNPLESYALEEILELGGSLTIKKDNLK